MRVDFIIMTDFLFERLRGRERDWLFAWRGAAAVEIARDE